MQKTDNVIQVLKPSKHLQKAFKLLGRIPGIYCYSRIQRKNRDMSIAATIVRKYGSWSNALFCTFHSHELLQLPYPFSDVTKEDLDKTLNSIIRIYREGSLTMDSVPTILRSQALTFFGSWNNALAESGLMPKRKTLWIRGQRKVKEQEINVALHGARQEINGRLTGAKYSRLREAKHPWWPSLCLILRKYGSWKSTLEAFRIPDFQEETMPKTNQINDVLQKVQSILVCRPFLMRDDILTLPKWQSIAFIGNLLGTDVIVLPRGKISQSVMRIAQNNFPLPETQSAQKGRNFAFMYADGLSLQDIANNASCSRENVRQYILKYANCRLIRRSHPPNLATVTNALQTAEQEIHGRLTLMKYEEIRRLRHPDWPSASTIRGTYGNWKEVLNNCKFQQEETDARKIEEVDCLIWAYKREHPEVNYIPICKIQNVSSIKRDTLVNLVRSHGLYIIYVSDENMYHALFYAAKNSFPSCEQQKHFTHRKAALAKAIAVYYWCGYTSQEIASTLHLSLSYVPLLLDRYLSNLGYLSHRRCQDVR